MESNENAVSATNVGHQCNGAFAGRLKALSQGYFTVLISLIVPPLRRDATPLLSDI